MDTDELVYLRRALDLLEQSADEAEARTHAATLADHAAQIAGGEYRGPCNGWTNRET